MTTIAVVYHSGYGHTKKLADAVVKGIESTGAKSLLVSAPDWQAHEDALKAADGIIFGAPTYMGSASAPFKQFMDETAKIWFTQGWKDKIAAGFTNSGSFSGDKLQVLMQLAIFAAQHSMIWVGTGEMPSQTRNPEDVNRIGSFLGVMAQSDNADASVTPPSGDLKTAELLGARVAAITGRFTK